MIEAALIVLAINAAITVATRSGMRKHGIEPASGETMFVVLGLVGGIFIFIAAFVRALRQE